MTDSSLRDLPGVDRLLREPRLAALAERYSRGQLVDGARELLGEWRHRLRRDGSPPVRAVPRANDLADELARRLEIAARPALRRALNATGVVIHTNLGRAPLSAAALAAMEAVGKGYSNLEYDLEAGQRGSRHEHLSEPLRRLTGAEAALVVNNNAAAVLLVLSALAA